MLDYLYDTHLFYTKQYILGVGRP